jgi:hypothetical protein
MKLYFPSSFSGAMPWRISLLTKGSFPIIPDNNGFDDRSKEKKENAVESPSIETLLRRARRLFPDESRLFLGYRNSALERPHGKSSISITIIFYFLWVNPSMPWLVLKDKTQELLGKGKR